MENITKGAVVLKSAPTAVDMGLINAQSIRELKAEEVFLFRIAACDNQVDRDFECFSDAALEALPARSERTISSSGPHRLMCPTWTHFSGAPCPLRSF